MDFLAPDHMRGEDHGVLVGNSERGRGPGSGKINADGNFLRFCPNARSKYQEHANYDGRSFHFIASSLVVNVSIENPSFLPLVRIGFFLESKALSWHAEEDYRFLIRSSQECAEESCPPTAPAPPRPR